LRLVHKNRRKCSCHDRNKIIGNKENQGTRIEIATCTKKAYKETPLLRREHISRDILKSSEVRAQELRLPLAPRKHGYLSSYTEN
jgi:hypothetical protein